MLQWLRKQIARPTPHDLRRQVGLLLPQQLPDDLSTRREDATSWPELIDALERRAATLREEQALLRRQLADAQGFVRFTP